MQKQIDNPFDSVANRPGKVAAPAFLTGLALVAFIFFTILISSILFIFRISVTALTPMAALFLSGTMVSYFTKKSGLGKPKLLLPVLLTFLLVILGSVLLAGVISDCTYDGNSYHKAMIGMLRDGWNPVYETMEEFDAQAVRSFGFTQADTFWENHYAKAAHIFAANIYKITGNVETGKSINLISMAALLFIILSYLITQGKSPLFIILFSFIVCTYPVFTVQIFTNYVDLLLGIYLFMLIFCFFLMEEAEFSHFRTETLSLIFMALCIMINIKFSAFAYAGIYCLGYYVWYAVRLARQDLDPKFFVRLTVTAVAALLVGVLVIGLSVYPKNLIEHGHPFYPLFGKDKVDIMTANEPVNFPELSGVERFLSATFSKANNITQASGTTPEYKLPFTVYQEELSVLGSVDLRISGHGVFFSGIFLVSLAVLLILYCRSTKQNKIRFVLTAIPLCINIILIFTLGEIWWARYFPQLYLFPMFAVLHLDDFSQKTASAVKAFLLTALLLNSLATCSSVFTQTLSYNRTVNVQFSEFQTTAENSDGIIVLSSGTFKGSFYNAFDRLPEGTDCRIELKDIPGEEKAGKPLLDGYLRWRLEQAK